MFNNQLRSNQESTLSVKRQPSKMWPDIPFEYTGNTGLTVKGNITGKLYRYNKKGDSALIDYRDAPAMMRAPSLKKLK